MPERNKTNYKYLVINKPNVNPTDNRVIMKWSNFASCKSWTAKQMAVKNNGQY